MDGCRFRTPGDITLPAVRSWLDALQADRDPPVLPDEPDRFRPGELALLLGISREAVSELASRHGIIFTGNGKARTLPRSECLDLLAIACRGSSARTASYYAREARAFTAWLVEQGALPMDPLRHLPSATAQSSGRHERRAMEEDEVERLLSSTRASDRTFRGLSGESRHYLYLVALSTGFRMDELRSLTPEAFRLQDTPPVVLLGRASSKNRKGATQPLPSVVVPALRTWLTARPAGKPLWPGTWLPDAADMLRIDLVAAGIPHIVPGPDGDLFVDAHALRHAYIARLDRAGVMNRGR